MYSTNLNNSRVAFLLLLGTLSFCDHLTAMKFNDQDINELLKPTQHLSVTYDQSENRILVLDMTKENLKVGTTDIDNIGNLKEIFYNLKYNPNNHFNKTSVNTVQISAGTSMNHHACRLTAKEQITLQAQTSLCIAYSFIKCPKTAFISNEMKFTHCFFIKPHELHMEAISPESNCHIVHIKFNKSSCNPTVLAGHIDFAKNQTPQRLLLTNVKKIDFTFNPHVFDKTK